MEKSYLHTKFAILGGSFASAAPSLGTEDFLVSGILAVFGASVSFFVSLLLKLLLRKLKYRHSLFKNKHNKSKK